MNATLAALFFAAGATVGFASSFWLIDDVRREANARESAAAAKHAVTACQDAALACGKVQP